MSLAAAAALMVAAVAPAQMRTPAPSSAGVPPRDAHSARTQARAAPQRPNPAGRRHRDRADHARRIAFGNLECAISDRCFAVSKQFTFRGRPERLAQVVRHASLDALNLANNHAGDYGTNALLDAVRHVRANGVLPVGAGAMLNFVWAAGSPLSSATGILRVKLSGRGVEGHELLRARIEGTRPRLLGG